MVHGDGACMFGVSRRGGGDEMVGQHVSIHASLMLSPTLVELSRLHSPAGPAGIIDTTHHHNTTQHGE